MSSEAGFCGTFDDIRRFRGRNEALILGARLGRASRSFQRGREVQTDIVSFGHYAERALESDDSAIVLPSGRKQAAEAGLHVRTVRLQLRGAIELALRLVEPARVDEHVGEPHSV